MKIIELQFNLSSGGAERFTVDLSNQLSNTDDVTLITLKDDKVEPKKRCFYKFDLLSTVKYKNLGFGNGFKLSYWWKIYRIIKKENPDIVHLNSGDLAKFCFLAIVLLGRKVKFFETIHNGLHPNYAHGQRRLFINLFGRTKMMRYIALSDTNYEEMREYYPFMHITNIVNGRAVQRPTVKYDEVKRELNKFRTNENTLLFVHVARCHFQKNQQLLVDAFNKLDEEGANVALIVIGANYDSEYGRNIFAHANKNIHCLGTRKNIADYLLNSDIFTLSSSFEGMPISLIEASLCGLPLVSTPVCGSVDIIKDKFNGVLSKDFTLNGYLNALKDAIRNYKDLKNNAKNMVAESPYKMEICAKKYRNYFIESLNKK